MTTHPTPDNPDTLAARTRHLPGFKPVPQYRRDGVLEVVLILSEETRRKVLRLAVIEP